MMKTQTEKVAQLYDEYVMPTYGRTPLVLVKAKGSRVWDVEGREYLDLFPGWGVSAVGYNHPFVMKALRGQSTRVLHVSNNYYHPYQAKAAKALVDRAFKGKVFFCNSGTEAIEAAIKFARLWGRGRHEIIVMEGSFHGRTFGAMSATGQDKTQKGFDPLVPGFVRVPFGDMDALEAAITDKTAAVLLEPVQGEGGINLVDNALMKQIREICNRHTLLMMVDEVQTGMGRTGKWFGYQHSGIEPDVMVLAKAVGGGYPVGAIIVRKDLADTMGPGTHGSTYGGSPAACACILAVIETIEKQELLKRTQAFSEYAFNRLRAFKEKNIWIKEVRGRGLMIGIELTKPGASIVDAMRERGVLINCTQGNILRLLPAMTITKQQLRKGLVVLETVLSEQGS